VQAHRSTLDPAKLEWPVKSVGSDCLVCLLEPSAVQAGAPHGDIDTSRGSTEEFQKHFLSLYATGMDLIRLHVPQVPRLSDESHLDGLTVDAYLRQSTRDCQLVISKRHDDGLQWTTVGHEGHHKVEVSAKVRRR
jgi:hypothetical protein